MGNGEANGGKGNDGNINDGKPNKGTSSEEKSNEGQIFAGKGNELMSTDAMSPHTVYVGLGSNTQDACGRLSEAVRAIEGLPGSALVRTSGVYHTEPQGYRDQPWFANSVAQFTFEPQWEPAPLLSAFFAIEAQLGRVREPGALRFGPRAIDIDLLLFDALVSEDPFCTIPHPRMLERAFVLVPLGEIAPDLLLYGKAISWYLEGIVWRREGMKIFQAET